MERSVLVRVRANLADFKREMVAGAAAVKGLGDTVKGTAPRVRSAFAEITDSARRNEQAWRTAGTALVAFGALTVGALGLTAKAAIDWENAWTGVTKTVEGTPQQLQDVEDGLRDLARELPATHGEIAAVAEAAGQLGIATPDVVRFTKVMVDLGETTNLTAEEAATSIAQLMNIMQTAPNQVGNLGSALVALGNDGASTERQIIQMAQRIAGAGRIIGLTEADVLGLANALASVGIEVEAGGTAISRVMTDIAQAVSAGGRDLDGFAQVAGVSADQFARAFREDPAEAITLFVEGLDRINRSGGDVFGTLDELGQSDIRVSRALLSMAGAGDLLRNSLDLGARSWEENTALVEEAEKRYDTTAAKIAIAKNNIIDTAITLGEMFLPAISAVAEAVADLAQFLGDLPGPLQAVAVGMSGLAGFTALAAGGFLLLLPRALETAAAFRTLRADAPRAATAIGRLGRAAGVAGSVLVLVSALEAIHQASVEAGTGIGEMTEALLNLRTGRTDEAIDRLIEKRDKLADRNIWTAVATNLTSFGSGVAAVRHDADELANELDSVDNALTSLVQSGAIDEADDAVRRLGEAYGIPSDRIDEWIQDKFPNYVDSLAQVRADHQLAAESVDPLQDKLADLAARFGLTGEDAAEAAQEMLDAWSEASTEFISLTDAYAVAFDRLMEKEREQAEAAAEAAGESTSSWEDFANEVKVSIDEVITELEKQVEAQASWAENLAIITARGVDDALYDHLVRLGPEGAGLVQAFADATDEEFDRAQQLWRESTSEGVAGVAQRLAEGGPILRQIANEHGQDVADNIALGMAQNATTVQEEAKAQGIAIDEGVGTDRKRNVPVGPVLEGNDVDSVRRGLDNLTLPRSVTITANFVAGNIGNLLAGRLADGGIVQFAEGGEHHTAQIAPAGSWRVWAEPETGGEAYIPLGEGKRSRSLSILGDVADRFGYNLIRANAMRFADGGITTSRAGGAPAATHVTNNQFQLNSAAAAATARGYAREVNVQQRRDDAVRGRYPVGG